MNGARVQGRTGALRTAGLLGGLACAPAADRLPVLEVAGWRSDVERCLVSRGLWTLDVGLRTSLKAIQRALGSRATLAKNVRVYHRRRHIVMAQ